MSLPCWKHTPTAACVCPASGPSRIPGDRGAPWGEGVRAARRSPEPRRGAWALRRLGLRRPPARTVPRDVPDHARGLYRIPVVWHAPVCVWIRIHAVAVGGGDGRGAPAGGTGRSEEWRLGTAYLRLGAARKRAHLGPWSQVSVMKWRVCTAWTCAAGFRRRGQKAASEDSARRHRFQAARWP